MPLTPAFWRVFRRRFFTACVAAVVVMTASIVYLNIRVDDTLAATKKISGITFPDGPAEGGNYLLVGSDSRAFVQDNAQAQAFGTTSDTGGKRSDTIMVLHVDPVTKTSLLVSFPRDLLVDIPGQGLGQINSTFDQGPQLLIDTLKANFNLDINHYVEVDFQAFINVVDAIGSVDVYFPYPARDTYSGLDIPLAGCRALDGNGALAYVRSRHLQYLKNGSWTDASPLADIDRIGRQQDFIRKLASQASAKAGENPLTAIEIADAVVAKLTVDDKLSKDDILRLVKTFRNVDPTQTGALEMVTLPWRESTTQAGRLVPKQPDADQLIARLRTFGDGATAKGATVAPADVTVQVLNGSSKNGAAGESLAKLQERGFAPGGVGNAPLTDTTTIRYLPDARAQAELVARYLGGVGRLVEDSTLSGVDVTIVIGADWGGIHGKDKAVKPTATSTTTAPKKSTKPAADPAAAC